VPVAAITRQAIPAQLARALSRSRETMSRLCEEFEISRKTGYKILQRYRDCGVDGLTDRSRRPYRHANQLPVQIETLIVRLKREKPAWGAPKIRERLARLYPDVHRPAISTVHAVLDRRGLVKRRKGRRHRATGTALSATRDPNGLWCADDKGEFMLADRRSCYPLTISDFASRSLIACEALHSTKEVYAFRVFESAFKAFGRPQAIRTDNGVPFASPGKPIIECPPRMECPSLTSVTPSRRHRACAAAMRQNGRLFSTRGRPGSPAFKR
jgi:putative transposase